jgi:hypothetical protein
MKNSKKVEIKSNNGIGQKPANQESADILVRISSRIAEVMGECPGIYVGAMCNCGGLVFKLDTQKDIPEEVNQILDDYEPDLVEGDDYA